MFELNELKKLLYYDPETGEFVWLVQPNGRVRVGNTAGSIHIKGYREIQVHRKLYKAHRLAWFWMTGSWPIEQIDHINGSRDDNRWDNLREASRSLNAQNRRTAKRNTKTGFLGVSQHAGKFQASIWLEGKANHLGTYNTPESAHEAYVKAKRRLHPGCTL